MRGWRWVRRSVWLGTRCERRISRLRSYTASETWLWWIWRCGALDFVVEDGLALALDGDIVAVVMCT